MKGWVKWLLAGVLAVPVALVALLLVMMFLAQDYYKEQISAVVEARTGRPLVIAGDLKLRLGMKPEFHAGTVRYPNAPWAAQPWAIEVERAVFAVDLWALLDGKLLVEDIVLEKPRLRVERNPDGIYNLAIRPRGAQSDPDPDLDPDRAGQNQSPRASLPWGLEISSAEIIDGEITVAARRHWDIHIHTARAESVGRGRPVKVAFHGAVEDTPVTASATLGSLQTLFTWQPSPLNADGWVGIAENRVRADGSAGNLLKWRDIDLDLGFQLTNVREWSLLAGRTLPDVGAVKGRARLRQPGRLGTMTLRDIELHGVPWGLTTTVSGEIRQAYSRKGIDLRIIAAGGLEHPLGERLTSLAQRVNPVHGGAPLEADLTARLGGSTRDLRVEIEAAELENAGLTLNTQGEIGFVDGIWRGALPVSLVMQNFGAPDEPGDSGDSGYPTNPAELASRTLSPLAPLNATAELTREQGAWRLDNVQLSLEREALSVRASGVVNDLGVRTSGQFYVLAEAADGRYLQPLFAAPLPPLADLELQAGVEFAAATGTVSARASVNKLVVGMYGADFSATGTIAELQRLRGIDLEVRAQAEGLQVLPPVAGRALPAIGPVRGSARLTNDESGAFHLTGISASVSDTPAEFAARGEIRNLGASMGAELDVDLTLTDAGPVEAWFADSGSVPRWVTVLPVVTPLRVSGKLQSRGAGRWRVRDLQGESLRTVQNARLDARLSGKIDAFAPPDAHLGLKFGGLAVSSLPAGWNIPRPRDGKLEVSLDVIARAENVSLKNIAGVLDSPEVKVTLHGDIDRLQPIAINHLTLEFRADSLAALNWPATARLNPDNPVAGHLTMMAAGVHSNRATVNLQVGPSDVRGDLPSDVRGDLKWRWPTDAQSLPRVDGELFSRRLDVAQMLLPEPEPEPEPGNKQQRFFSPAPINTDWMHKLNGRVSVNAGEVNTRRLVISDVDAQLALDNGKLMQTITAQMGDGHLALKLAVDATARPVAVELQMNGKKLDSAGLAALPKGGFVGGTVDAAIEVTAAGGSMAALAGGADGRVSLGLNGMRMKNQSLDFIGGDIFFNLINTVNPFRSIDEYIDIECSVLAFDIEKGVASSEKNLAIKTDRVTLLAGGTIDLRDESLKILISPKARRGLGISPSSLAKVARVGGTLAEPRIEADASRLWQTGATVWAALSTGGLSLFAQGLLDRSQANADVCGLAGKADAEEQDARGVSEVVR